MKIAFERYGCEFFIAISFLIYSSVNVSTEEMEVTKLSP